MKIKLILRIIFMMFVLVQAGNADTIENIQEYFNDTATKVKVTNDVVQKRNILIKSLQTISKALDKVERSGLISQDDRIGVNHFKSDLQEKQDELMGSNGYERVSDAQLNAFANYVVQDMEQADRTITISLVAVLLIVVILLLL